jgi:hypothetical protein
VGKLVDKEGDVTNTVRDVARQHQANGEEGWGEWGGT